MWKCDYNEINFPHSAWSYRRTLRWNRPGLKVYHFHNGHQVLNGNVPACINVNELFFVPTRKFLASELGKKPSFQSLVVWFIPIQAQLSFSVENEIIFLNPNGIAKLWILIPPWIILEIMESKTQSCRVRILGQCGLKVRAVVKRFHKFMINAF